MQKLVLGIFSDRQDTERAIQELESQGYNPKDFSLMMKDQKQADEMSKEHHTGEDMAGGAVSGATTGAVVGGLAGLLGAFVIPGLGAFLIGGPIAAALGLTGAAAATVSGAATGAVAGGLLGALTGLGLSESEAKDYEKSIQEGGILLAVPARTGEEREIEMLLEETGASQIKSFNPRIRSENRREETAQPAYFSEVSRDKKEDNW